MDKRQTIINLLNLLDNNQESRLDLLTEIQIQSSDDEILHLCEEIRESLSGDNWQELFSTKEL